MCSFPNNRETEHKEVCAQWYQSLPKYATWHWGKKEGEKEGEEERGREREEDGRTEDTDWGLWYWW